MLAVYRIRHLPAFPALRLAELNEQQICSAWVCMRYPQPGHHMIRNCPVCRSGFVIFDDKHLVSLALTGHCWVYLLFLLSSGICQIMPWTALLIIPIDNDVFVFPAQYLAKHHCLLSFVLVLALVVRLCGTISTFQIGVDHVLWFSFFSPIPLRPLLNSSCCCLKIIRLSTAYPLWFYLHKTQL